MRTEAFIRPETEVPYLVAERIADVLPMLTHAVANSPALKSGTPVAQL
jgi:hypothetical protein